MRKALVVGLALLISAAFAGAVFAQSTTEKAAKTATDMAQEKARTSQEGLKNKAKQTPDEKTVPAPDKAAPAPEKKAEKKDMAGARAKHAKGEVTAVDMAAKSMTIKGKTGDITFDTAGAKMKAEPKVGDKVFVKYTEAEGKMIAKYVAFMKHHKGHKGHRKEEKKEVAPAEKPAVSQPAPEPAK